MNELQEGDGKRRPKKVKIPSIKTDKKGRRYFLVIKKKVYIPRDMGRNELIRYILDTFVKRKRRLAKKMKTVKNGKITYGSSGVDPKFNGIISHLNHLLAQSNIPRLAQALEQKLLTAPAPKADAKSVEGKEGKHDDKIGGFTILPSGKKLSYLDSEKEAAEEAQDLVRRIGQRAAQAVSQAQAAESERQEAERLAELAQKGQQLSVSELQKVNLRNLREQRRKEKVNIEFQTTKNLKRETMIADYNKIAGSGALQAGVRGTDKEFVLRKFLELPKQENKDKQKVLATYLKLYEEASHKVKSRREPEYKVPSPPPSPKTPPLRERANTGSSGASSTGSVQRQLDFSQKVPADIVAEILGTKGFERAVLRNKWMHASKNADIADIKDQDVVDDLVFKYRDPDVLRKYLDIKEQQEGFGLHSRKGLMSDEIYAIMRKYPEFVDVVPRDGIPKYILPYVHPGKDCAFIINSDKEGSRGQHWFAIYVSPVKHKSVEFYDSFGREMPQDIANDVKLLVDRMSPEQYLKLKENRIVDQRANSDECGYFAMDFLMRRLRGQPFRDITGYSDVSKAEKDIKVLKDKYKDFDFFNSK